LKGVELAWLWLKMRLNSSGSPGSRFQLNTPALVLDIEALAHNIRCMASFCAESGVSLRPHAKTHKSSIIAKHQIEAGAVGVCCATIDEAEVMERAGIRGLLITTPLVSADKIARLIAVVQRAPDTVVVADHPQNVEALAESAQAGGVCIRVLVDVDLGHHRTGVLDAQHAIALARRIDARPSLAFAGIQAYGGHLQHVRGPRLRRERVEAATEVVRDLVDKLHAAGLGPAIVSGAGTGTYEMDAKSGTFTELQAGSYIFMDADYHSVGLERDAAWPFKVALFVQTMVISTNIAGFVTTDGGTKAFAVNGPPPQIASGTPVIWNAQFQSVL
jgi:D-serine deaminase-like pyridoxal phosphate-dependent protein